MSTTIPILLERDNVNDETVTLVRWLVGHGERVEADKPIAEVETSKANLEVYAPASGYLVHAYAQGAEVPVSSAIGHVSDQAPSESAEVSSQKAVAVPTPAIAAAPAGNGRVATKVAVSTALPSAPIAEYQQRFSPLALKMMEANGLTAAQFSTKSVVRKQDVLDFLNPGAAPERKENAAPARRAEIFGRPITQPVRQVPLSKAKRYEAATLAAGMANAVTSAVSVMCYTRGLRRILEEQSGGFNASAVILYEVSRLLRKYPSFNAAYVDGAMLQYEQVNLGFAVDDGRGLKVAVIPGCDVLSLQQVAGQMRDLTLAYLDDKLTPAQTSDATFTVSDLSSLGVSNFFPLISVNQGAILGVGGEQFAPGAEYGSFTLTLSFDHQLSDGRTASLFLTDLKNRLLHYENTRAERAQSLACSHCFRTVGQLAQLKEFLLRSADPDGYLCTICAAGGPEK